MRRPSSFWLRLTVVLAFAVALGASAAPTTIQLKNVKFKGTPGTEGIIDWAVTSAKGGVVLMCDGDNDKQCNPGLTFLRTNGKTKPFKDLGRDEAAAALAWPGGGVADARAKPMGTVAVLDRSGEDLALFTGRVKGNGKLKGSLKETAVILGDTSLVPQQVDVQAAMSGDRTGIAVAYIDSPRDVVQFFIVDRKGKLVQRLDLEYRGTDSGVETEVRDLIGDDDGWYLLASQHERAAQVSGSGQLLGWHVPADTTRARITAITIADTRVPGDAEAVLYRGSFVRDLGTTTVLYEEIVRRDNQTARALDVAPNDITRYLTAFEDNGRTARMEVPVQAWNRVSQIWDLSASAVPFLIETTSEAIAHDGAHVFALGRTISAAIPGVSSHSDPRQEYSIYRLDPDTGQTELLSRLARSSPDAGSFEPVLLRRFGKTATTLFNFNRTFSHMDAPMLTSF